MFEERALRSRRTISPPFDMSRIFSFFLVCFLATSASSYAQQANIYLVEGVPVTVAGKSPSASRNVAATTAHRDAFLILLTRLSLNANIADSITDEEISDMVRSEHIDNEKIAGNSYSATFEITFAKDFVEHILAQKNSKNSQNSEAKIVKNAESYLLIPVKITGRTALLWEEKNDWKKAVEKVISKKAQSQFISPDADVENLANLNRDNLPAIDYVTLEPMLLRYKSSSAYVMNFSFDAVANKAAVDISYIRKLQKKQIKLSFINADNLGQEALMLKVAEKTLDYLTNSQTSASEGKISNSSSVRFEIYISSLAAWFAIKNKIENSNLVSQLNIESISRDYVLIKVNYVNYGSDIVESFARMGISLTKKSDDLYSLNAN